MSSPKKVLVVGGGASGALTAIALRRVGFTPTQIDIAEPRALLAEGLAYQTRDPWHRLNVPTGKLSAIEDEPNDFVEWSQADSYSFMERRNYSTYLRDRLGQGVAHICESVIDLDELPSGQIQATFSRGEKKNYDFVILAMGNGKARIPDFLKDLPESPRVIRDVWDGSALPESKTLICFGTGLSFIDIAVTHLERDPQNKVIALSGSGNLPERHVQAAINPFTPTLEEVSTLAKLREYLASSDELWREAVDGLRPIMQSMWRGFTPGEREEFLRTDGSAWSKRRHRIAPEIAERIDSEIESGRIRLIKGRVSKVNETPERISLELTDGQIFEGDLLALCIGRNYELSDPLSLNLLKEGKASRGPLGMGLSVDISTGLLLKPNGSSYQQVYAIGPLRSGEAFESTAIPEIRKQATAIAKRLELFHV